ncbi:MAG TPA: hypothetical protein VJW77_11435 [Terriglobia bacterium]|nr:hypothetical protein [Terriglobia bacterium]
MSGTFKAISCLAMWAMLLMAFPPLMAGQQAPSTTVKVWISWGYNVAQAHDYYIKLNPDDGTKIENVRGASLEAGEGVHNGAWQTRAGGGDIDGLSFDLHYPQQPPPRTQNLGDVVWAALLAHSSADTTRRLMQDAAFWIDPPKFTVQMNQQGTQGFTVTVEQLLEHKALWLPSLGIYITQGGHPVSFAENQKDLEPWKGKSILHKVNSGPDSSYAEYTPRWADTGNPDYKHPDSVPPGHIVCLTWDSAIRKFGIDRWAGVRNDYGNPDHFQFSYAFENIGADLTKYWKGQSLDDGLPVITTKFEKDGVQYSIEQFAYPLDGPPAGRRGNIPMVLLQKVDVKNLDASPKSISVAMFHEREISPDYANQGIIARTEGNATIFEDAGYHQALFSIQGDSSHLEWSGRREGRGRMKGIEVIDFLDLPAKGLESFVVKLASPMLDANQLDALLKLDYEAARSRTLSFWSNYVAQGAQFQVPEKVVNELFKQSLWRALMLPRRHGGNGNDVQIDLPYSNFAYQQTGTPWPVNQAVYIDYMLYDQRGYHSISTEELLAMYRNNQEADGHVNGNASWGSYTPGMLYAVAQNYLLSHDRHALDQLLPYTLKSLNWCLNEMRLADARSGPSHGLFLAPLNDGTGNGVWAFNQAYMYAGLEAFGMVLRETGNPHAQEALDAARKIHQAIEQEFGRATMLSPVVQLRNHTWVPFVPNNALVPRRNLDEWYPADVDTGVIHLLRLGALPADGELADYMLDDQEDNLFYQGWGMDNEPVYMPQATAYLLRDDPKAVIRDFYSNLASAFSHTVLEPLEHRWAHQQYYGPPSTDGSWFNLYRHVLIDDLQKGTLFLGQATPRKWLEDGDTIKVSKAPTYFGTLSYTIRSQMDSGRITASVDLENGKPPESLLVRFRDPQAKPMRSVTVNGQEWTDFNAAKEWVRIKNPSEKHYEVVASY